MRPFDRRRARDAERGFTLIELLVVMLIIAVLAAIAIPVLLSERQKARDTATESDVSRLGKEVTSFYIDGTGSLTLDTTSTAGSVTLTSGATVVSSIALSTGTVLQAVPYKATAGTESITWCVALTNPSGLQKAFYYSASSGLHTGACP